MLKPLFDLPKPTGSKERSAALAKKASAATTVQVMRNSSTSPKAGVADIINNIKISVTKYLGKYADRYVAIREEEELSSYISNCIENGVCSFDTETTSLDPITCTIAGFSIYTPGQKAAYIPIHHKSYVTNLEVANQISSKFCTEQLQRLVDSNVKFITFNGKFDRRVVKHQLGVIFTPYWCGYIASRLLNENEREGGLKSLHRKYCLNGEGDAFAFDDLFDKVLFTYIPINTGYLYAARDAEITYELYKFQEPYLTKGTFECKDQELEGVADLFWNIEMPCVEVVAELEDTGVYFDFEIADKYSEKYHKMLVEREKAFYVVCEKYSDEIDKYKRIQGKACKLDNPINIGSSTQIAILLYDILKLSNKDSKKPRGTGEPILQTMDHEVVKTILDYRETAKQLSTYIDKLPEVVNLKDNRIHASFNQVGADTGRFSSKDPNLQNIPSRGEAKELRKMFKATPGYVIISSDYSAQEPRITAHMCNDAKMIQAYREGKDLYCAIASIAFDVPYEECLEHYPDGTANKEGKERRRRAKTIVLGVCYGKGIKAIAEDLHITKPKAQEIYNKIMISFPGLKQFMEDCKEMAITKGYVDTVWGRKRRLPNIQLQPYEFSLASGSSNPNFNPLLDEDDDEMPEGIPQDVMDYYIDKLNHAWGPKKADIRAEAKQEGIIIKDNTMLIAEAERQTVNSRIQGSAADQTKNAMNLVYRDPLMRELGFRMLIPVHDEIIGEAPEEVAKQAGERLSALMVKAAERLNVPSKCDVTYSYCWEGKEVEFNDEEINYDEEENN